MTRSLEETGLNQAGRSPVAQARMLCYSLGPVSGALFLRFWQHGPLWAVRFHAIHSILISAAWGVAWGILRLAEAIAPWFTGAVVRELRFALNVGFAFAWILLLISAYQGTRLVIFAPLHRLAVKLARRYERTAGATAS